MKNSKKNKNVILDEQGNALTAPQQDGVEGGMVPANGAAAITPQGGIDNKTKSRGLKIITVLLYLVSFGTIFGMTFILAIKSVQLVPYYSFWPFLGSILVGVFALIFFVIVLVVSRHRSKRSMRYQNIAIVVTFFCLTSVFALLMDVVFPDVISMATQGTLRTDALYNLGEEQLNINAGLDRQFIRYNILNGNMNQNKDIEYGTAGGRDTDGDDGRYAYKDMTEPQRDTDGTILSYKDLYINNLHKVYLKTEIGDPQNNIPGNPGYLKGIVNGMPERKRELYDFIYNSYTLQDVNYALQGSSPESRQALTIAMVDKTYAYYQKLCKEGMSNERIAYLFKNNFASMNQDGYNTFDDALLLFAQMSGRMTVSVIIRLILDETYTLSQPVYNLEHPLHVRGADGELTDEIMLDKDDLPIYAIDNFGESPLYTLYDPAYVSEHWNDEYMQDKGEYRVSNDGFQMFANGQVKKPIKWCVLDMDGNNMGIISGVDLGGLEVGGINLGGILGTALQLPIITEILDSILNGAVPQIIKVAANGAVLSISLYTDDNGGLTMAIVPSNVKYGVLGFQFMSWMESNKLLVGVINLMSIRNYLYIFGAIGLFFVFAAGLCRERSRKLKDSVSGGSGGKGGKGKGKKGKGGKGDEIPINNAFPEHT